MIRFLASLIFMLGVKLRLYLYAKKILKTKNCARLTVSVGNLSTGGTGKTPFVMMVDKVFSESGRIVAVVEKGYRSDLKKKEAVILRKTDGVRQDSFMGDESELVFKSISDSSVLSVCSSKTKGALEAVKFFPDINVVVLDDGFQHMGLERDLDIVLMDALLGFGQKMLPLGRLREPYSGLKRAHMVVFTKSDFVTAARKEELKSKALGYNPDLDVFFASTGFCSSKDIRGKFVIPVSAIAGTLHFHRSIEARGGMIKDYVSYPDHYRFKNDDVKYIEELINVQSADFIAVTSKDWIKLAPRVEKPEKFAVCSYEHTLDRPEEFRNCLLEW